jgi:hypothetical protein
MRLCMGPDVEYDPQAVLIIRQNWIDKQLKLR